MRKTFWIIGALLVCAAGVAPSAHADSVTVTDTGSTNPYDGTFAGFNTSLGTLTDFTYDFSFTEMTSGSGLIEFSASLPILVNDNQLTFGTSDSGTLVESFTDDTAPADLATAIAGFDISIEAECLSPLTCVSDSASYSVTYDYTPAAAPEPGTSGLVLIGLLALGLLAMRKRIAQEFA
jgi:hypothetical protein